MNQDSMESVGNETSVLALSAAVDGDGPEDLAYSALPSALSTAKMAIFSEYAFGSSKKK